MGKFSDQRKDQKIKTKKFKTDEKIGAISTISFIFHCDLTAPVAGALASVATRHSTLASPRKRWDEAGTISSNSVAEPAFLSGSWMVLQSAFLSLLSHQFLIVDNASLLAGFHFTMALILCKGAIKHNSNSG